MAQDHRATRIDSSLGAHSPPTPELCLCHECESASRAKRLLDFTEQVQAPQSAKKACLLSHLQSTPGPSEELLPCSRGSASSHFPNDTGYNNLFASSSASKYGDAAFSRYARRCFDNTAPDDVLLELSDDEESSSFDYTEEEIQRILASDSEESEQNLIRKSTWSQTENEKSEKAKSSSTGASALSKEAELEMMEKPNEPLSRDSSSANTEELMNELSALTESSWQSAPVSPQMGMLFELDIQELLTLSPIDPDRVDQLLEVSLEEAEREASEAVAEDGLGSDKAAGSSGWPRSPTPSSGAREQELAEAAESRALRQSDSPEDDDEESTEDKEPSNT